MRDSTSATPRTAAARTNFVSRVSRLARPLALVAGALWAGAGPALAVNPNLTTSVEPIPQRVTHSSALYPTFAAYQFTVTSFKPQPTAGVRLVGTATVAGGTGSATLYGAIGEAVVCQGASAFDCQIGPLPGGGIAKTFTLILNAPSNGAAINLAYDVFFDESGAGGADGVVDSETTALSDTSTTEITSFIVPAGATFGTGNGFATAANPSTTTVVVPGSSGATTAKILEIDECVPEVAASCSSEITIPPGTFANVLRITLWRDASTFRTGTKAQDFVILHTTDGGVQSLVQDCSVTLGPFPTAPCVESRMIVTKKTAPTLGLSPEAAAAAVGDFRGVILSFSNGSWHF